MKALKCDFCSGPLIMDKSREFATCEFCGTKYTKETVQDKIQEIKGSVKIEGAVETTTGETEKLRLLKNAETYTQLNEFNQALEVYKQVTNQFPGDYRGWWGIYTTQIEKYFATNQFAESDSNALKNSFNLCQDKTVLAKYFDSVVKRYGKKLRVVKPKDKINITLAKNTPFPFAIDPFTEWLLFGQSTNIPFFPKLFIDFLINLSANYVAGIKSGMICAKETPYNPIFCNEKLYINVSNLSTDTLVNFVAAINHARHSIAKINNTADSPSFYKIGWGNNYVDVTKINGFCGRWIYTLNKEGKKVTAKSSVEITLPMILKLQGLCTHCGGRFKGIFNPVCQNCGKPKDY